ncbi:DUF2637 domain-containing protein [Streptomyces desertarenae]|uniref:DUF2637 domain-containing protein n=1 Tax=Streptomyces desertarenae TaxID=2666184 RepID=A0ABW4PNL3_9ACTN
MGDPGQYYDPYGMAPGGPQNGYRPAGGHPEFVPAPAPEQGHPAVPDVDLLDPSWDFEAELAKLLRDSGRLHDPAGQHAPHQPQEPSAPQPEGRADDATWVLRRFDPSDEGAPADGSGEPAPARSPTRQRSDRRHRRRRRTPHRSEVSWLHMFSFAIAALTAGIVAMVSVLGGLVSYDPLRQVAGPGVPSDLARWWPLLIYGPWLAGSLSILRATVLRRRVRHSWAVVIAFSTVAVALCVAEAPRTLAGIAAAGLPPITALACFHQLVGQITLTQPRHALPRRPAPLPQQRGPLPRKRTARRPEGRG